MAERIFKAVSWSYNTNIYEVNLRQYTTQGTFKAFRDELPRLRDMGVEILWFMPITPISREKRLGILGSYYACSNYTDTNPEFGTVDDFRELVAAAHALGFKVIIDWVANHTGWDHVWTVSHPEFYKRNAVGEWYDSHGWEDVIDLNYYDHGLRKEMTEAMKFWVNECNIDGFRCDMAHLVPLDFWRNARTTLDAIRPLFWLGETEDANYFEVFDGGYAWNWMHQTEKFMKGTVGLDSLIATLNDYERYPAGSFHMFFTSNHDENSWNGTEYEKYGELAIPLTVFSFTWKGVPMIYSGQEMPNLKRLKFFEKDTIEWTGDHTLHDFYKKLIKLRTDHQAIRSTECDPVIIPTNANNAVLAFTRRYKDQLLLVLLNFSGNEQVVELPAVLHENIFYDALTEARTGIAPHIGLGPWKWIVLSNFLKPA